ncbi:MAG: metallophosphoesterase [Bacteroidota bacterium]
MKMCPALITVLLLIPLATTTFSQPLDQEDHQIVSSVETFFRSIETADAKMASKVLSPQLISISRKNGAVDFKMYDQILTTIAEAKNWKEESLGYSVTKSHNFAVVKTPYNFYIDGALSHCGTDTFDMVKTPNMGWQIKQIKYDVKTTDCMESEKPDFKIGLIADVQYCDCPNTKRRYYKTSLDKLASCLKDLNAQQPDFYLDMGDLIDRDWKSYEEVLQIYKRAEAPVYRVIGNHDYDIEEARKYQVKKVLELPANYYHKTHKGWRFIMLDGNEVSTYAPGPHKARAKATLLQLEQSGAEHAKPFNGGMSQKQLEWLKTQLNEAKTAGEKVIVVNHFPVYPATRHTLWNKEELMDILSSSDELVAYLCGHNHEGNYGYLNGVHYLTLKGMVDTPDETAYSLMEVYSDKLVIKGTGREPSRILQF